MSILVIDGRFEPIETQPDWFPFQEGVVTDATHVDVEADADPRKLVECMDCIDSVAAFRIAMPSSHDGRPFSIARALRLAGYAGEIRISGPMLADQYPLALRSGVDSVEISQSHAERQGASQWREAIQRVQGGYRESLMAPSAHLNHSDTKTAPAA